jgi:hypothetical protein
MTDEISTLDATAQAELVHRGELTPEEVVEGAIARIERVNPRLNAVIHPLFEKARETAKSGPADGPLPHRRRSLPRGDALLERARLRGGARYRAGAPFPGGGLHLRRQDEYARARHVGDDRAPRLRSDPQPLGARSFSRRLQRGLGGRRGRGAGSRGPRQRHGGVHPYSREPLRPGRTEADPGSRYAGSRLLRVLGPPHPRARGDAVVARQRGGPRCHRGPGTRRSLYGPRSVAPLRARGRRRSRKPAHRTRDLLGAVRHPH